MFDLELTDEQKLVRDTLQSFAAERIQPIARECDEAGAIPAALAAQAFELGLIHSPLPEAFGGYGEIRSAVTGALVAEELGHGDLSIALHLLAPRLLAYALVDGGSEEQKARFLPAFAAGPHVATAAVVEPRFDFDTTAFAVEARREGSDWVINGEKCLVPLAAEASAILVLAQTGDGPGAFIVERDRAGLTIGNREKNMGLRALATHHLSLSGVRVPETSRLPALDVPRWLDHGRVALAAMACGMARGASEFARDYAKERKAFGMAIAQKQAVAFMLADMAIEVDAMRLLIWEAAWRLDQGLPAATECARARRYAAASTLKVADNALQVLGGHGYIRDYPVELWLRNARGLSAFEGMSIV